MKTLLLVDDEHAIVDALTGILEDEGYRVVTASNGRDGLVRLADEKPDLVLLDVMMPVMGGREMLAKLRAHPETKGLPVIMMSAVPLTVLQRDEKTPLPFTLFVQKPFDLDPLLAAIARLVESTNMGPG